MRLVCVVAIVAVLAVPTAAAAPLARAWPGATIHYRDLTGAHGYHGAVARAVAAWNRLRLGIRFVPAPAGATAVRIVFEPRHCLSGDAGSATSGFQPAGGRVVVGACPLVVRPLLVTHQLGLVLGLRVVARGCSLMNSTVASDGANRAVPGGCIHGPPPRWLRSLVDPATATRARRLYARPGPPGSPTIAAGVQPRIEWRQPTGTGAARTVLARAAGGCPTEFALAADATTVVYDRPAAAGLHRVTDTTLPAVAKTYCYRLFNVSRFGRATPAAASAPFRYDVGPAVALTAVIATNGDVTFRDQSSDPDGTIVHWRWTFGDPASGAANVLDTSDPASGRAPTHSYAHAGSYIVSLTVTDDHGKRETASLAVAVPS